MIDDDYDYAEGEQEPPSKSELKRQMHALQQAGETLVQLTAGDLARIPMPDNLAEAIATAQRIKSREGLRRQLQYIGKLMRKIDAEPILEALEERERGQQELNRRFHQLEDLREQMVSEGQSAIDAFMADYPLADRQKLRQLVRKAQQEKSRNLPPASSRKLFRYLRELMEEEIQGE